MALIDIFKTNCRRATYLHEKKKDGELSFGESLGLAIHLVYCRLCRVFVQQVELIEKCAKTATPKPVSLAQPAKDNMQNALDKQIKG